MIKIIVDQSASAATQPDPAEFLARHEPMSPPGLRLIESASNFYGIALGRNDEFIFPESDDEESTILNTPGVNLPSRLQRAIPFVAPYSPLIGSNLEEVMERLWSCDDLFALRRARNPSSTQIKLSADKWMAQVREWASSHPQRDHVVDDSRESIYGDRV